ncbi:MAG: T9SS type A sorting domain-containing protein [Bacteroidales bacterium]|nr:T9SS type A sorting domain-containing protein [Bacteroidales bacterium]
MKTIYKKLKLIEILKPLALIILLLAFGYTTQSQTSNSPVCKNQQNIELSCAGGVVDKCEANSAEYSWINNNDPDYTSTEKNPVILIGNQHYRAGTYFLTVRYHIPPDLVTWYTQNGHTTVVFIDSLNPAGHAIGDQTICPNTIPPDPLQCERFGAPKSFAWINYQWEESTDLSNWSDIGSMAVGLPPLFLVPDLVISTPLPVTTYYRVRAWLDYCLTIPAEYSNVVTITVQAPPLAGTIEPAQTICYGAIPATLNGSPEGTSYIWESTVSPFTIWTPIVGEIGQNLSFTTGLTQTTRYHRFSVTNCTSAATDPLEITVQSIPTAGEIAQNQTICNGTVPAPLTSLLDGTGDGTITYAWESSTDGINWGPAVPAQTGAGFDFGVTELTQTTMYRRFTVSTIGLIPCQSEFPTNIVTIIVQPVISSGTIETSQTICYNTTPANLTGSTVTSPGAIISYIWEKNVPPSTDWTVDPLQTGTGYPFAAALTETTLYRRTTVAVVGVDTCYSDPTTPVTITVESPPSAGEIEESQTICYGETPATLDGSTEGTSYSWEWSISPFLNWTEIIGAIGEDYSPGALTVTTKYRRWTFSGNCKSLVPTIPVEITVQSVPSAGEIAANQTICNGTTPADLTSIVAGTGDDPTPTYLWESSTDGINWVPAVPESSLEGYAFGSTVLTETTMYHRITVSTVGTKACYSQPTVPVTIIVQPVIEAGSIAAAQTICYGATPDPIIGTEILTGPGAFITYMWEYMSASTPAWTEIPGAILKDFAPPALIETTDYRRTTISIVGLDTCASIPTDPLTITVQIVPTVGSIAESQTICSGYEPDCIGPGTPGTGSGVITYLWYSSLDGINWGSAIPGETGETYCPGVLIQTTYYKRTTVSTLGTSVCTTQAFTDSVRILVTDAPNPWVEGPMELCQYNCATYTAHGFLPGDIIEWSVSGTYTTIDYFESSINICWGACTSGSVTVTVSRGNCVTSYTLPVILHAPPAPLIVGPITVNNGDTLTYYALPGDPGHLFNWTVLNGTIYSGQGTDTIQVIWNSPCLGCTGQVCVYESIPEFITCNHGSACMDVFILPDNANVFGYVTYENDYNTGVNNVRLTLRNAVDYSIVGEAVSGPNFLSNGEPGYFAFVGIPYGNYLLTADNFVSEGYSDYYGYGIWGGNNATDALIVQMSIPGPLTTPVKTLAADVNGSLTISALDALFIKLRVIESIDEYPAGDWAFVPATFTMDALNPVKDFGTTFHGLCYGDVNGSFIPTGFKAAPSMSAVEDGVVSVSVGESFTYDIRSNATADLGAMTLYLNYDQKLFDVEKVNTNLDGLQYKIENGKLVLAWADTKGISVGNGEPILSLTVKAKEMLSEATPLFSVGERSEFANSNAVVYDNFNLKMASVITAGKTFSIVNYPNPFQNTTSIVYTLPEAGQVRLVITDMFGKTVGTLVNSMQASGTHTVIVNPADLSLSQGVYLYKIEVNGTTDNYSKVNKLIYQK